MDRDWGRRQVRRRNGVNGLYIGMTLGNCWRLLWSAFNADISNFRYWPLDFRNADSDWFGHGNIIPFLHIKYDDAI